MKKFKLLSLGSNSQWKGVFYLGAFVGIVQLGLLIFPRFIKEPVADDIKDFEVDSLVYKSQLVSGKAKLNVRPFNPNYLTDAKGYALGMSTLEIDRWFAYRQKGLYANSLEEFKRVTQVSNDLLKSMAPYFSFPKDPVKKSSIKLKKENLNKVDALALTKVKGVGPVLSKRIIAYRNSLGQFDSIEQLYKVYGLDSTVVSRLMYYFEVP